MMKKRALFLFLSLAFISCSGCAIIQNMGLAEKPGPFSQFKDGTFIGENITAICKVKLEVTIDNGYIRKIEILDKYHTWPVAVIAYRKIPKRIVEQQSLGVDTITGATVSSNNIRSAVLDALKKAKKRPKR